MPHPWMFLLLTLVTRIPAFQEPVSVAGCYQFDKPYFGWTERDTAIRKWTFPKTDRIRLVADSIVTVFGRRGLLVRPIPEPRDSAEQRRWYRISHWRTSGTDWIWLEWRNGFHGPVFELRPVDGGLSGKVRQTTDIHADGMPEPGWEPAKAVRIPCP